VNDGYKVRSRDLYYDIMLNYHLLQKLNLIRYRSFNLLVFILTGGYRGVLPTHDVWSEESETLSIPLLQRPIGDDSTTLGPQEG
jgi:hypothetical protein